MTDLDKRLLLTLARQTIAAHLAGEEFPPLPSVHSDTGPVGGVFVTLRGSGRRLRGCIGRFHPPGGVAETVQEMALAALADPRFRHCPVLPDEVAGLHIEISVLSPMVRTRDPLALELGVHGIYVRRGHAGGCFLPQVATEQRWDRETFLSRCCADKAGLPADAWKDTETEVYLFTSSVLEE